MLKQCAYIQVNVIILIVSDQEDRPERGRR
jgi:hypothetical protein